MAQRMSFSISILLRYLFFMNTSVELVSKAKAKAKADTIL